MNSQKKQQQSKWYMVRICLVSLIFAPSFLLTWHEMMGGDWLSETVFNWVRNVALISGPWFLVEAFLANLALQRQSRKTR